MIRVRSRETLGRIRALVERAVSETEYPGTTPPEFYHELHTRIADASLGVFVGFEDESPQALAVAMLPTSCMMIAPQVALVYSRGRPPLIRAVGERLKAWIMAAGYDRVMGINLWREDAVFMRGFSWIGEPRRLGSLCEWRF